MSKWVSQIAYFCIKHLIFEVHECTKCVQSEKYVKMQLHTWCKLSVEK